MSTDRLFRRCRPYERRPLLRELDRRLEPECRLEPDLRLEFDFRRCLLSRDPSDEEEELDELREYRLDLVARRSREFERERRPRETDGPLRSREFDRALRSREFERTRRSLEGDVLRGGESKSSPSSSLILK